MRGGQLANEMKHGTSATEEHAPSRGPNTISGPSARGQAAELRSLAGAPAVQMEEEKQPDAAAAATPSAATPEAAAATPATATPEAAEATPAVAPEGEEKKKE